MFYHVGRAWPSTSASIGRQEAREQGQRLLRFSRRYTPERLDPACARALGFDLVDLRRLERILVLAPEHEGQPAPPAEQRIQRLPSDRFARPDGAFDHRFTALSPELTTVELDWGGPVDSVNVTRSIPIFGNSVLNRLANAAHQIVIEGPSYRAKLAPKHRVSDNGVVREEVIPTP